MAKVTFNVNAYTARLIGRENVATLNGAILELVKNTYDADASLCIIYYDEIDECVYLLDNGCGMNQEIILKNWMTIGNSSKKSNFVSKNGRIQTGAKGIGRFALDRLADVCQMLTVNNDSSLLWKVDWRDFDGENNITEITADLDFVNFGPDDFLANVHNDNVIKLVKENFKTGTLFKVANMRDRWSDTRLKSIRDNLRSFIPMEISKFFKIYIFNNINTINEAEVLTNNDDFSFDYKIDFEIKNSEGTITIVRNEFDILNNIGEVNRVLLEHDIDPFTEEDNQLFGCNEKKYNISVSELTNNLLEEFQDSFYGTFYFSKIIANKNDAKKYFYKNSSPKIVGDTFKGIKLYRDYFRVRPYGEYGTSNFDWLLLDSLKSKSPSAITGKGTWKVRSNQMFGTVCISRINNGLLDQSNREGIVETKEFKALREALTYIISLFERDRQYVFRKLRSYNEIVDEIARIEREIKEKAEREEKEKEESENNKAKIIGPDEEVLKEFNDLNFASSNYVSALDVKKVLDKKDNEIRNLEEENNLLMILATTGIVTNTYIHEFKAQTQLLNNDVRTALDALNREKLDVCKKSLLRAHEVRQSLNSWFEVTINAISRDKRRMKTINVVEYLSHYLGNWNSLLNQINITIRMEALNDVINFRCFPYELDAIFSNLITNSITSFSKDDRDGKNIIIKVEENMDILIIYYQDNGSGLSKVYKDNPNRILEQFVSDKINEVGELVGTGMGMYILKAIVDSYNGEIVLDENKSIDTGFMIKIYLKGVK